MHQAMEQFEKKKPVRAALHWDGKLVKDTDGDLQENEVILVSGSPHYVEGKLLSVSKLYGEYDNPSSTGEVQAGAVIEQLKQWNV